MADYSDGSRFKLNALTYIDPRDNIKKIDYKMPVINKSNNDKFHVIGPGEEYRPDLISLSYYGVSNLEWIIMLANEFESLKDFTVGVTIRIPDLGPIKGRIV